MDQWRCNCFQQQGGFCFTNPMYRIDFANPVLDWREGTVTYKLIPRSSLLGHYQDGSVQSPDDAKVRTLSHSTRDAFVAPILHAGLKTTYQSHGGIYCWFKDCVNQDNFNWGLSPCDTLQGCVISVVADSAAVIRRRRFGADRTKALVRGDAAFSTSIPIRCVSVTFRIPSPQLRAWRDQLYNVCKQSIDTHGSLFMDKAAKKTALKSLWGMLSQCPPTCYDRNAHPTGRWTKVHTISVNMAAEMGSVLQAIIYGNNARRRRVMARIVWLKLPTPFQVFLQDTYVGRAPSTAVKSFFQQEPNFDPTVDLWVKGLTEETNSHSARMSHMAQNNVPCPEQRSSSSRGQSSRG